MKVIYDYRREQKFEHNGKTYVIRRASEAGFASATIPSKT